MIRGDLVIVGTRGTYTSKPRPVLIVQSDMFNETHGSITVCPVTSDVLDAPLFRVSVPPGTRTGLRSTSQVMVDKVVSVPRSAIGRRIGGCDSAELQLVDDALRRWLAL
jgi:mRNA interferase MazF